jgi:hypothetical protein
MPDEVGLKRKERRKKMFGFGIFPTLIVGAIAIFWGIVIVKAIPGIIKAFKGEMKIKYDPFVVKKELAMLKKRNNDILENPSWHSIQGNKWHDMF